MKEFTFKELEKYNSKNGNPAYIAVKGKVYDVTNNSHWTNGDHHGFEAGHDLTDPLYNKSPHGDSVLSKINFLAERLKINHNSNMVLH
ncbi:cytochrome B5 [Lactobacillus crispatus]|uniref:Cytochrome B5 n=1 Tax=Lactobacillus crispatus TaxID=47770 RepID=A0A109DC96_9LACO|nr:cytochrome b5 domain-containing protein [Lactobacillus crispatus]KWU02774.1 cytochrome B5 [Lactobacillus crispatus]